MLGIIILKQETPDSNPTHRLFVILIWSPYLRQLHILNDLDYKRKLLFLVYVSKLNTLQAEVIIPFLSHSLAPCNMAHCFFPASFCLLSFHSHSNSNDKYTI